MNISLKPLSYIFAYVGNVRSQLPMSNGPLAYQQAYTTVVTKSEIFPQNVSWCHDVTSFQIVEEVS